MRNGKWKFQPAVVERSTEALANPYRGFYQIHTFFLEKEVDFEELRWCVHKEDTLVFVMLQIGAYSEEKLPPEAQRRMEQILSFFREHKKQIILRVVYDNEGKGLEKEPKRLATVLEHIDQIGPIMQAFSDCIFVYQGLLVGSWGEMHHTRFVTREAMKKLYDALYRYCQNEISIAVRTPAQARTIHKKMGIFDDGILGSDTHLGTFGECERGTASYEQPWGRDEEFAYIQMTAEQYPIGGEAILGENVDLAKAVSEFTTMHVTYLNRVHDPRFIQMLCDSVWRSKDEWNGMDGFSYVERHLGYRIELQEVKCEMEKKEQMAKISFRLENVGFAECYRPLEIVLSLQGREVVRIPYKNGIHVCQIPFSEGTLELSLVRQDNQEEIRLGNTSSCLGKFSFIPGLFHRGKDK